VNEPDFTPEDYRDAILSTVTMSEGGDDGADT
jgi:hypothetical protein